MDPTTESSSPTQSRDELIDTAIKFLQNPKVRNSSLAQKQQFLQRRGLTDEEIRIACERSGTYDHHEQQQRTVAMSQQPYVLPLARECSQVSLIHQIKEILHSVAIFSIFAYILKKLYELYIAPFLFGKKKKSLEEKLEDFEKDVRSSIDEIKTNLGEVRTEFDRVNFSSENELVSQLKDFKAELASVKGLLLTRKQFPSVANNPVVPPSIPAWQMSSVHEGNGNDGEENKEELLEVGSGSGSSEPEHCTKTSESSLEIIYSSKDCDSESCHSKKSSKEDNDKD